MGEVFEVGDLSGLPLQSHVLELVDLEAADWHPFGEYAVYAVAVDLCLEGEVVALVSCYLKADLCYAKDTYRN